MKGETTSYPGPLYAIPALWVRNWFVNIPSGSARVEKFSIGWVITGWTRDEP